MLKERPMILLQKMDPAEVMARLAEAAGGLTREESIQTMLKRGEDSFLGVEQLTAVAVFSGGVSTALTIQRTFGEEKFKFPSDINEGATKTRIVFQHNLRQWREVLGPCTLPSAHPRLKQVTIPILIKLKKNLPLIFEDIDYDHSFPLSDYGELIESN